MIEQIIALFFPSLLVVASIFVIIFIIVYISLRDASFCSNTVAAILALCVTMLFLISLMGFPSVTVIEHPPEIPQKQEMPDMNFNWLLLPYEALAVTLIAFLFFLLFYKIRQNRIAKKSYEVTNRKIKHIKERRSREINDLPKSISQQDQQFSKITRDDRLS
ncbi:hypothetical protein ACFL02_04080 [Planctomycetota bacterium]